MKIVDKTGTLMKALIDSLKILALGLIFSCVGCTYSIVHTPLTATSPARDGQVTLIVPPETAQKVQKEKVGINVDAWEFHIGNAITSIVPQVLRQQFGEIVLTDKDNSSSRKESFPRFQVRFLSFDADFGLTVFSEHTVTLECEVIYSSSKASNPEKRVIKVNGSSSGADRATTWGGLIISPLATFGMNEAFSIALTDSVVKLAQSMLAMQ